MNKITTIITSLFLMFSSPAWANDTLIEIKDHHFIPANITIKMGTKITWTNKDSDPHTVFSQGNTFHSSALDTNDTYSYIFTKPGRYKYFCTLHPVMTGNVIVQ